MKRKNNKKAKQIIQSLGKRQGQNSAKPASAKAEGLFNKKTKKSSGKLSKTPKAKMPKSVKGKSLTLAQKIKKANLKQKLLDKLSSDKFKIFSAKNRKSAEQMAGKQDVWRFLIVWLIIAISFCILTARAFYIQIGARDYYVKKGEQFSTSVVAVPVIRGMITDRFGVPLAATAPLTTVIFSPYDYAVEYYERLKKYKNAKEENKEKARMALEEISLDKIAAAANFPLERLSKAVAIQENIDVNDAKVVQSALPKSQYMVLIKDVTPEVAQNVLSVNIRGLHTEDKGKRFYMQAEPTAQILGFMANSDQNDGYKGRAGLEAQFDDILSGEAGKARVLRNGKRYQLRLLEEIKAVVPSQDVVTTIDARLQYVLYKEMEQAGRHQSAKWVSGIVVDVHTGDVLAMGSWPSFNANNLSDRTGATERNRVLLDSFEPGSVMKPFTVAAALESGRYHGQSLIDTNPGSLRLPGYSIRDSGNYGEVTLAKLIQKSSNVASAKIALDLPKTAIADIQQRFGFGKKTALNFPAETSGRLRPPKEAETSRQATLAYGYGQSVTLAQLVQAYAALGNGGVMNPLRLIENAPKTKPVQVIDQKYADEIVQMMELVTEQGGIGTQAAINGYRVAGKTGTTRRNNPQGGYFKDQYRTIFVGVAPASNPRFAVAILLEDPRKNQYAGPAAGPVFASVMQEVLRLYNVPFDKALYKNSIAYARID